MDAPKHNRDFCLDCGRKLNRHEWLYGACSDCIKKRAKKNRWKPYTSKGIKVNPDDRGWFYADNAPRWNEYADFHDMDDEGVLTLMEKVFGGRNYGFYAARDAAKPEPKPEPAPPPPPKPKVPEGMVKCRHCNRYIPIGRRVVCEECRSKVSERIKELREIRKRHHLCVICGVPLPKDWEVLMCDPCRRKARANDRKLREKMKKRKMEAQA